MCNCILVHTKNVAGIVGINTAIYHFFFEGNTEYPKLFENALDVSLKNDDANSYISETIYYKLLVLSNLHEDNEIILELNKNLTQIKLAEREQLLIEFAQFIRNFYYGLQPSFNKTEKLLKYYEGSPYYYDILYLHNKVIWKNYFIQRDFKNLVLLSQKIINNSRHKSVFKYGKSEMLRYELVLILENGIDTFYDRSEAWFENIKHKYSSFHQSIILWVRASILTNNDKLEEAFIIQNKILKKSNVPAAILFQINERVIDKIIENKENVSGINKYLDGMFNIAFSTKSNYYINISLLKEIDINLYLENYSSVKTLLDSCQHYPIEDDFLEAAKNTAYNLILPFLTKKETVIKELISNSLHKKLSYEDQNNILKPYFKEDSILTKNIENHSESNKKLGHSSINYAIQIISVLICIFILIIFLVKKNLLLTLKTLLYL